MSSVQAERSVEEVSTRKALAVLSFLVSVGCSDTLVPTTGEPLGTWAGEVLTFRGTFQDVNHLRGTLANAQGQTTPLTFTRR